MKHAQLSEGEEIWEVFTVLSSSRKGEGKEKPFPYIFCVSFIVFRWQWWWLGVLAEIWLMDTCCMFCFQIANCRERMETTLKAGYLQSYFSYVGMDSYDERVFFKMF